MLGLTKPGPYREPVKAVERKMMTTLDGVHGYETVEAFGLVEVALEKGFAAMNVAGVGVVGGGGLADIVDAAKDALALLAAEYGANAVVGLRFVIEGRELEKSVLAYGTAVHGRRLPDRL